jgi:predicted MFS family arabinose efflux permease
VAQARARLARRRTRLERVALRQPAGSTRRLTALVGLLFAVECVLYSAVTPLLPHYAAAYHLSKTGAGLLAASYSVGFILGAPLGGWAAARQVRRALLGGLALFAAAAVAFAAASTIDTLDATRFVQGIAGGVIWSAALAWLIVAVAPRERGVAVGTAFGAATTGTVLGPVVGTIAVAGAGGWIFAALGVISAGLAVPILRADDPSDAGGLLRGASAARLRPALAAGALVAVVGATLGALGVLVPLRLAARGASGLEVGVTFVGAALVAALVARLVGGAVNRRGPSTPLRICLLVCALCLGAIAAPSPGFLLAALTILAIAAGAGGCIGPCVTLAAEATERAGGSLAAAAAAVNASFACGEIAGASGAPALARTLTEAAPLGALAVLAVAAATLAGGVVPAQPSAR